MKDGTPVRITRFHVAFPIGGGGVWRKQGYPFGSFGSATVTSGSGHFRVSCKEQSSVLRLR